MDWIKKRVKQTTRPPFATLEEYQRAAAEIARVIRDGQSETPTPPEPEPVATEVIGWRGWTLKNEFDPTLVSPTYHAVWESAVLRADPLPRRDNSAGIHALKETPGMGHPQAWFYFNSAVWGRVALSGIVVEGEHGYRGEQAVIRELWLSDPDHNPFVERYAPIELAAMLEQKYQVEVGFSDPGIWRLWKEHLEWQAKFNAIRRV